MINKSNWKMTRRYLDYRLQVDQVSPDSMEKEKTHLRYLLEWAQETSFSEVVTHRPTFPEFLLVHRLDGHQGHLSAVYIKKILSTVRMFFTWLSDNGYKNIKQAWVKTIKVKRLSDVPKNKEIVTLEEILAIARAETLTREERRARASLVFLYLSGMRIGAFVSLPVRCVDISNRLVDQFPSLGVRTKNGKHATTYLLDIPELLHVVQSWHDEVVTTPPFCSYWFSFLSSELLDFHPVGKFRSNLARRSFKAWLDRVGLLYHSPHKFRHGHIHYGLMRSKNVADFKAVSMNVMHSTIEITDQFYSVLHDDEVKNRIGSLGKVYPVGQDEQIEKIKRFLDWEKQNK
jgi:site-specific recombinase XerC